MLILILALIHTAIPIVFASIGRTSNAVYWGGGVAAILAVAMGNPAFAVLDLFFAACGVWIGLRIVKGKGPGVSRPG